MADEAKVEIKPVLPITSTETSESKGGGEKVESENLSNFRGRGGSFRGGRGRGRPFRGGPFQGGRGGGNFHPNRGGPGDRNEQHQEFRGRGRGGFRRGRGGGGFGDGGRGAGPLEDQSADGDREQSFRPRGPIDKIADKISSFQGPTFDLPPVDMSEKPFNGGNRLFLGNIGNEITEEDLTELFKPFGETSEVFINKDKEFGFIKMDSHANAEKAKQALDAMQLKGKNLRVRFAPSSAAVKVKNLSNFVTNELLYFAFSPFGEIEKVHVCADVRGKPTGEGYIHFARKFSAIAAVKKCTEGCYFLTSSLQPAIVELYDAVDDTGGYSEKNIVIKTAAFMSERERPPRFAIPDSFEFKYGQKWKSLHEMFQQKEEALKKELQLETEKLAAQMKYASYEQETEQLRKQLLIREMDKERQKREWEMKERRVEEERIRQQEEMNARTKANLEDMSRRRQEHNLFMQAHNLNSLLDQTEQACDQNQHFNESGGSGVADSETKPFFEGHNRFEGRDGQEGSGPNSHAGGNGHWVSDNRRGGRGGGGDYQNKRRRF